MEMQQIRYFLALCEEESFTRAARRCGVSQPSLTAAIRRLEKDLGGSLFHRTSRGTKLSPLGAAVRPYLQQIDRFAEKAKREATTFPAASVASTFKTMEKSMRKIAYGAAVVAGVLLLAVIVVRQPPSATATTQIQAGDIVNVRALEKKINIQGLPAGDVEDGED
jgi:molybdenum-dependent DNA-binding transcriptional regulator ModE